MKKIFPQYNKFKLIKRNLNFRYFNESLPFYLVDYKKNIIVFKKEENGEPEFYNLENGNIILNFDCKCYILKDEYIHVYQLN